MASPEKYAFFTKVLDVLSPVISFVIGWLIQSPIKKKPIEDEKKDDSK